METRIKISPEDNLEVWRLFHKYNAMLNILAYMNKDNDTYSDYMEKKIDETVELSLQLEAAKSKCKMKYAPENGNYSTYTFDFENQELIFGE